MNVEPGDLVMWDFEQYEFDDHDPLIWSSISKEKYEIKRNSLMIVISTTDNIALLTSFGARMFSIDDIKIGAYTYDRMSNSHYRPISLKRLS